MRWIALLLCVLFVPTRADAQRDTSFTAYWAKFDYVADSLSRLKPASELRSALARGDRRFVGIQGFAVEVPGVHKNDPLYPSSAHVQIIPGTSDGIRGSKGARLNRVAAAYAGSYNRLLLAELRRRNR